MGNPLMDRAPLRELAERGQVIDIIDKLSIFEQLVDIVEDDFRLLATDEVPQNWRQLPVTIKLRFHWADARRQIAAAEGDVAVTVPMVCQRCLGPFENAMTLPLRLLFATSEGVPSGNVDYELWELDGDELRPLDVVEEALIMALPLAAVHESAADCTAAANSMQVGNAETVRPFADLRSQMRDRE